MKKWINKKSIILAVIILIIISGVVTIFVKGFEKSIEYTKRTRLEIFIGKGYEKEDILAIADESFSSNKISFVEMEKTNQLAGINIKEYTNEELDSFKNKISEKYQIDSKELEVYEISVPETSINTIVEPYILPTILVTVISMIYIMLRNIKNNGIILSVKILGKLVLVLGTYFAVIALFRLPIEIYTMPVALLMYVITLLVNVRKK